MLNSYKKINLDKPRDISQFNIYEANKNELTATANIFASKNSMPCRPEQGVILYCEKMPRTLVAFEDQSGFTICLFGIGTSWERSKFQDIAGALEKSLIDSLPNVKLKVSLPEEIPECLVPQ